MSIGIANSSINVTSRLIAVFARDFALHQPSKQHCPSVWNRQRGLSPILWDCW